MQQFLSHVMPRIASSITDGAGKACGDLCANNDLNGIFGKITNTLIFLVGAISVIMIVIGGLRYVLSNGDSKSAEGARNTILYAVIGLIVSVAAYALVTFVLKSFPG